MIPTGAPNEIFPDPETHADEQGIVAVGGSLSIERLTSAYRRGIFPWPVEGYPMLWFSPDPRAILEFDRLHLGRSLRKSMKRSEFTVTVDEAFKQVIIACGRVPRPGQDGTWITPELLRAYVKWHEAGAAHSIEVWERGMLVGGLYGVEVDGAFSGESMFHARPDASKFALLYLVQWLQSRGLEWMDIQMLTPHMEALGARAIPRSAFLKKLTQTHALGLKLFPSRPSEA